MIQALEVPHSSCESRTGRFSTRLVEFFSSVVEAQTLIFTQGFSQAALKCSSSFPMLLLDLESALILGGRTSSCAYREETSASLSCEHSCCLGYHFWCRTSIGATILEAFQKDKNSGQHILSVAAASPNYGSKVDAETGARGVEQCLDGNFVFDKNHPWGGQIRYCLESTLEVLGL